MRIIHITFSLENGGKENMLVDIANEQAKAGHLVTIIIINRLVDKVVMHKISPIVETIYLKRGNRISRVFTVLNLFLILRFKANPDVIHCHDIYLGKHLHKIAKCKVVITIHGLGLPVDQLRYFDKIFCISDTVRNNIETRSYFKGITIYNGVYSNRIKQRSESNTNTTFRLIQVGNLLQEFKGQDVLIKAMNILINKKGIQNLHLDLVGEGYSRSLFEQMIKGFKLENHVKLLGSKSRDWIYDNLSKYDIFIQASRNEGFGLTVAEAMAAKLPVIASLHDGPAEVLGFGKYGLLFENENSEDLASKICEIIKLNGNKKLSNMIDNAYAHCIKNFEISTTAMNYLNNY
jgi:glycosyltransferase involved in cell wall biosynthesis